MAILSNVPTLSYVSWKDMIITYEGQSYQIQNSYTMKPYIYWDYNNPYQLTTSNEMLRELAGRFYIMFNDKGIYTLVPQTSIEINFADGVSSDLIAEKILGFKEALENVDGEKFATIEQTVDGIKQTVGIIEEQVNGNTQLISTLQQTASDITAEINRVEREFNLFVCFGFPAQEKWIDENAKKIPSLRLCMGLGGALDVWSGSVSRAPKIVQSIKLEWLWRTLSDKKRYHNFYDISRFLFLIFLQRSAKIK